MPFQILSYIPRRYKNKHLYVYVHIQPLSPAPTRNSCLQERGLFVTIVANRREIVSTWRHAFNGGKTRTEREGRVERRTPSIKTVDDRAGDYESNSRHNRQAVVHKLTSVCRVNDDLGQQASRPILLREIRRKGDPM